MVRGLKEFNQPLDIIKQRLSSTSTYQDIDIITAQLREYTREAGAVLTKLETDSKAVDDHYNAIKLDAQKKRKRDDDDSAVAPPPPSAASPAGTPTPTTTTSTPTGQNLKSRRIRQVPKKSLSFELPSTSQIPRPPRTKPLPSTPKTQDVVNDDFVDKKPASQTQISSFYASIEPYLRPLGEDDLMFLSAKGDDVTPYTIPPLGRPYLSVWEAEDAGLPFTSIDPPTIPPLSRPLLTAQDVTDDGLVNEDVSLGALSERLVSALLPTSTPSQEYTEQADSVTSDKVSVGVLDDALRRELIGLGILGESDSGPTQPIDDEISTQLAQLQHILKAQSQMNSYRRLHLLERAKERIAGQEYLTLLSDIEKTIETGWTKRQKQIARIKKKKTEKATQIAQQQASKQSGKLPALSGTSTPSQTSQNNMSADLMSDLGESVKKAIECRTLLIENVGRALMEENDRHPGKYFGVEEQEPGATVASIRDSVDALEKEPSMMPEDDDSPVVGGVRLR
ncbi:hypothetical protein E3P96_02775 [Wallemia ichthyophaga]|nr:hypothetical protein E3P96_02775 [Wallemia ichthyophaga]